jgi:hypothetical protein
MTHNIYRIYALLLISILFIFGMIMLEDSQFDVIWVNEHIHILLESIGGVFHYFSESAPFFRPDPLEL